MFLTNSSTVPRRSPFAFFKTARRRGSVCSIFSSALMPWSTSLKFSSPLPSSSNLDRSIRKRCPKREQMSRKIWRVCCFNLIVKKWLENHADFNPMVKRLENQVPKALDLNQMFASERRGQTARAGYCSTQVSHVPKTSRICEISKFFLERLRWSQMEMGFPFPTIFDPQIHDNLHVHLHI